MGSTRFVGWHSVAATRKLPRYLDRVLIPARDGHGVPPLQQ